MKTFVLAQAIALLVSGLAALQAATAAPASLYFPFAADGNAAVKFTVYDVAGANGHTPYTLTAATQGTEGTVTFTPAGNFIYKPGPHFSGQDSFSYTFTDSTGQSETGVVALTDFALIRGNYALNADPESSIPVTGGILALTSSGSFTVRVGSISEAGSFDKTGNFNINVSASSDGFEYQLEPRNGGTVILGSISYGGAMETQYVDLTGYKIIPAGANKGRYSVLFQPTAATGPQGTGWATMNVAAGGQVTFAGQLNDGQIFSSTSAVGPGGTFPMVISAFAGYTPQQAPPGGFQYYYYLHGSVTFQDVPGVSDFDGSAEYQILGYFNNILSPPPNQTYPDGFNINVNVIGSRFIPGGPGKHILKYSKSNGTALLTFTGGDLTAETSGTAKVAPGDAVTAVTAPLQSLKIYAYDSPVFGDVGGIFSGYFLHPGVNARRAFSGVVFQKQNLAAGLFRGNTDTGTVTLTPQ